MQLAPPLLTDTLETDPTVVAPRKMLKVTLPSLTFAPVLDVIVAVSGTLVLPRLTDLPFVPVLVSARLIVSVPLMLPE